MTNYVTGPTTYDQLRWSANAFRSLGRRHPVHRCPRAPVFREALQDE